MIQARETYHSFEHLELVLKAIYCFTPLVVLYCPPLSNVLLVFDELAHYLGHLTTSPGYLLMVGDFDLHVDSDDTNG